MTSEDKRLSRFSLPESEDKTLWLNNVPKRVIPSHLVKRSNRGFNIDSVKRNDNSNSSSSSNNKSAVNGYNYTSFGEQKSNQKSIPGSNKELGASGFLDEGLSDLPPRKSIYDFGSDDDDNVDHLEPEKHLFKTNDEIINDPRAFSNIFNPKPRFGSSTTAHSNNKAPFKETFSRDIPSNFKRENLEPITNGESAVLLFGYNDSSFESLIQRFSKFGEILEDFHIGTGISGFSTIGSSTPLKRKSKSSSTSRSVYPIFVGKQWVKITYDNPSSAIRALKENGVIVDDHMVGVIPYTKSALETLLNAKISDSDDIGDTLGNISFGSPSKPLASEGSDGLENNGFKPLSHASQSFKIKDGTQLFKSTAKEEELKKQKEAQQSVGLLGKVSQSLFGFSVV
ncbi:Nuclear pore complex FG-nucleoporin component [Komagataella phaffii CBS 7435]|uniref:Nuclear pore complex subunit, part of a subcomplex also containing Nup53p, Nup170p, and Pse1p n=2 Tax=Komagataella phaffii TaxID=460519 RepID=C4R8J0_KOMPG|nr:Nuclear pore complex subunit, part of a subcomplex also containing Nup53p, Nup170p, and Pse1p [Komagataella phaffii GS115]AOA64935.1 GQ67_05032T0 [Komagataella phaffii]CAH2450683.1 Nuclear pore complex FG-nucleoporin component [Komagataella phaffii CBS 7435]AOA69952.1 GQ68_05013T0 [Komagataella phaffii GS115]CAY71915.1 Nuclear pore complex subunit, part of a subcomplex also containing Nup53p, Nup170p, and Pse1p [Komagataella phaffii GS115]CCA40483.1 Nuclear pore complex FG-nucleoporin compo